MSTYYVGSIIMCLYTSTLKGVLFFQYHWQSSINKFFFLIYNTFGIFFLEEKKSKSMKAHYFVIPTLIF